MEWVAFSYSLPSKEGSSPRVALWRRLRRLGALPIAGGTQILPARDECIESFQWLAQEIRASNGDAAVMRVRELQGMTDQQVVALFCEARTEDYRHIESQITELRKIAEESRETDPLQVRERLARLRHRFGEIARIDYFDCSEGKRVASSLDEVERALSPSPAVTDSVPRADAEKFRDQRWVTRPQPYVDRLACIWFIRHFINPNAPISYSGQIAEDVVGFDMDGGAFGHLGNLCTFETMKAAFAIEGPGLQSLAEIVHEIDLHDGRYTRPEVAGVEMVLKGWSDAGLSDSELEMRGISLFEGLFTSLSGKT